MNSSFNIQFFDEQKAMKRKRDGIQHVIAYARLSFDEDGSGYASIINQVDILTDYYKANFNASSSDFTVITDDNVSGYKFEREGLFKVFDLISNGKCDIILAKDLSRIGRHSALTQLFIESCQRVGIRIIAMEDYDSHKESDDIILGIKAWSNERVVKDTSAKILKIVKHKQENGTWFCAAPFGYIVNDYATADISIDEPAAAIVRRIFKMYLNGKGMNAICKTFAQEGIMTPSMREQELKFQKGKTYKKKVSSTWNPGQVSKLLGDEFYIGNLVTGRYKRRGINGMDVRTDKADQHVFENHHEAIISKEDFDAVQELRKSHVKENYRSSKNGETLFHGILFCGDCGSKLYTYKNKKLARQYICSKYFRGLGCTRHTLKEETLIDIAIHVLKAIRDQFPTVINSLDKELNEEKKRLSKQADGSSNLMAALDDKQRELEVIETQRIKQIVAHPDREEFYNETYDKMAAQVREDISKLQSSIKRLKKEEALFSNTAKKESISTAMAIIDSIIERRDIHRKDVVLLFKKITVFESGRVEVELNPDLSGALSENLSIPMGRRKKRPKTESGQEFNINVDRDGDPLESTFIRRILTISTTLSALASLQRQ